MCPLRAPTTGATTASASFSSPIGTPNLAIYVRAPANTINGCNNAGGKPRHAARRPVAQGQTRLVPPVLPPPRLPLCPISDRDRAAVQSVASFAKVIQIGLQPLNGNLLVRPFGGGGGH